MKADAKIVEMLDWAKINAPLVSVLLKDFNLKRQTKIQPPILP